MKPWRTLSARCQYKLLVLSILKSDKDGRDDQWKTGICEEEAPISSSRTRGEHFSTTSRSPHQTVQNPDKVQTAIKRNLQSPYEQSQKPLFWLLGQREHDMIQGTSCGHDVKCQSTILLSFWSPNMGSPDEFTLVLQYLDGELQQQPSLYIIRYSFIYLTNVEGLFYVFNFGLSVIMILTTGFFFFCKSLLILNHLHPTIGYRQSRDTAGESASPDPEPDHYLLLSSRDVRY